MCDIAVSGRCVRRMPTLFAHIRSVKHFGRRNPTRKLDFYLSRGKIPRADRTFESLLEASLRSEKVITCVCGVSAQKAALLVDGSSMRVSAEATQQTRSRDLRRKFRGF